MNKQALAFLTMFSLILMLSVYYVTLPSDGTKTVMKEETAQKDKKTENTSKKKEVATKTGEEGKLQESIDQKKDVEINKNNEIVANTESDEASKKEALLTIDTLKEQSALQKTIVDTLAKEGYKTAVEINDSTCIVNVFEQEESDKIAKNVLMKVSSITNNKYLLEVTFK